MKKWKKAKKVAKKIIVEKPSFKKATHFHTKEVKPKWSRSKKLKLVAVIGNHKFYKKVKNK